MNLSYLRQTRYLFGVFLLTCGLLLNGCSSTKILTPQQAALPRSLQSTVQLNGRISIQYQQDGEEKSATLNYDWQQTPAELHIGLSSFVGQTVANIHQTARGASLEQAKQATLYAADIEQLLVDSLGWSIPIEDLKTWLQGFDLQENKQVTPIPAQDNFELQSKGWQLRFVNWQEDAGTVHPKLIFLEKKTEQFGMVKIRIVISEWQA